MWLAFRSRRDERPPAGGPTRQKPAPMRCRDLASRAFSALAHDAPGHCVVCRDHSKHLRCPGALVLTPTIQFPDKLWLTSGVLSSGREGAGLPRIRRRAPKGAIGAAPRSQRDFRNQVLRMTKHHRPGTETLGMSQVLAPERIQMAWVSDRGDDGSTANNGRTWHEWSTKALTDKTAFPFTVPHWIWSHR